MESNLENILKKSACKSEYCMMSEYDGRVKNYWKISQGNYIVIMVDDEGLEDKVEKKFTMPLHLGSFVLSNSKTIMNTFFQAIKGFYTNDLFYTDTDSLCIENKH